MPILTLVAEQCLAPVPGGTGRYTAQLAAALAAGSPPGWRVRSVVAWHRAVAAARFPGVRGPRRLPAGRRVLTVAWERGLPPWPAGDSLHGATSLVPGRRGASGSIRPLVATVHDVVPWTHPETLTPRGVRWHRAAVARLSRIADAVVVPTQAVADDLARLFPFGDRIQVIGHGVTPLPVPADARDRRDRLGLPDRYVLSVGTLEPRKGLDVLLAAMAGLGETDLVVVGPPGWGGLDLTAEAVRVGMRPGRLHLTGRLADSDLASVYAGAAVLAVPSRAEGFGLPVLEGMAAGIPVVHSDIPVLAEVAGGAGVTFPVGDASALAETLAGVLSDEAAADRLSAAGRRRAAAFSWTTAAAQTWALHRRLAS